MPSAGTHGQFFFLFGTKQKKKTARFTQFKIFFGHETVFYPGAGILSK